MAAQIEQHRQRELLAQVHQLFDLEHREVGQRQAVLFGVEQVADAPLPDWLAGLVPPARREPATVTIPPGFVLVDVVLPAHKAFIARRWAAEAAGKVKAARAARSNAKGKAGGRERDPASAETAMRCSTAKADDCKAEAGPVSPEATMPGAGEASCSTARNGDAGPADLVEFTPAPGQRCEIVSVHHPVFAKEIGKRVIIVKVHRRSVASGCRRCPRYRQLGRNVQNAARRTCCLERARCGARC